MNSNSAAHGGWIAASVAWVVLHEQGITLGLQWGVAVAGIVAAVCAARYHIKAARKLDK